MAAAFRTLLNITASGTVAITLYAVFGALSSGAGASAADFTKRLHRHLRTKVTHAAGLNGSKKNGVKIFKCTSRPKRLKLQNN